MDQFLRSVGRAEGMGRRDFLKFCAGFALLAGAAGPIAASRALAEEAGALPRVIWLSLLGCSGCGESLLRIADPWPDELLTGGLRLEHSPLLMAASGAEAEALLAQGAAEGGHVCVIEGAAPLADAGAWCRIGGRAALDVVREACAGAGAVVAYGTCAAFGGLPAAAPNPSASKGIGAALGVEVVNLPGCPPNPLNLLAVLSQYLFLGRLPTLDAARRPTFAHGATVHTGCPKPHGCVAFLGCRGPYARNNCHAKRFNTGASWPVEAGHHCIGCCESAFWDRFTPLYKSDFPSAFALNYGGSNMYDAMTASAGLAGKGAHDE